MVGNSTRPVGGRSRERWAGFWQPLGPWGWIADAQECTRQTVETEAWLQDYVSSRERRRVFWFGSVEEGTGNRVGRQVGRWASLLLREEVGRQECG